MKKLTALLLLLLPILVSADPQLWMRKGNPDELHVITLVGPNCPVSNQILLDETHNVLIRSRLKPIKMFDEPPAISAVLDCQKVTTHEDDFIFLFVVDLIGPSQLADGSVHIVRYGSDMNYAAFGHGNWTSFKPILRQKIEDLIADYLRINFDLGEEE